MPVKWETKVFTLHGNVPLYRNSGTTMLLSSAIRVAEYHLNNAINKEQIPINWEVISVTFTRKDSK